MTFIDVIITLLVIIGIVGSGWLLIAFIIFLYGKIENIILRRRIPDKIKQEVENGRVKREERRDEASRRYAGTGNAEVEAALERIRSGINNQQPEDIQQMDDVRDSETERSSKSDRRRFRFYPV